MIFLIVFSYRSSILYVTHSIVSNLKKRRKKDFSTLHNLNYNDDVKDL